MLFSPLIDLFRKEAGGEVRYVKYTKEDAKREINDLRPDRVTKNIGTGLMIFAGFLCVWPFLSAFFK